jgi:ABC-type transport system involved in cytochrome c biogenesis ATPase subunit
MFDVPLEEQQRIRFKGELPVETNDWQIGLIVGPSGSGKSTILRSIFGTPQQLEWPEGLATIDCFDKAQSVQDIAAICQSVGFNTIPAWMRPYAVLSNGEKFRVELARHMLTDDAIVIDEFTSVVDRQVAQIGAHAVQKYIRKHPAKRFVAASCHYDIIDWLQPDWIFEPATMHFARRSLRGRPALDVEIRRCSYGLWQLFAPFHYLTAELNKAAACFTMYVGGRAAAFAGVLHRPHAQAKNIKGLSRLVTLPDWQGLALGPILAEKMGAAYKGAGFRFRTYPAHPALIRAFAHRSDLWRLTKRGGDFSPRAGATSTAAMGGRPCAVFEYIGGAMDSEAAKRLIDKG